MKMNNHITYRATIKLHTAFGTPLVGDTLFGQLCWAIAEQMGQDELNRLLQGYCQGKPYVVVSDAFAHGYLPMPTLPSYLLGEMKPDDRKLIKVKVWVPEAMINQPITNWRVNAKSDSEVFGKKPIHRLQLHNTINRSTGTTGEGMFAPYQMGQIWYTPDVTLDIYLVIDRELISPDHIQAALINIGLMGYGRDASIGLGKFSVTDWKPHQWAQTEQTDSKAYLTLAPCAPQGIGLDQTKSYYQPITRFGRHGNRHALAGQPFKKPIIMVKTGAYLSMSNPLDQSIAWIGQGISGHSTAHPNTVHQGYAPVVLVQAL